MDADTKATLRQMPDAMLEMVIMFPNGYTEEQIAEVVAIRAERRAS